MKEGTKVKVVGVTDRDDKQIYGMIVTYEVDGLCIVDIGERVIGIMSTELVEEKK